MIIRLLLVFLLAVPSLAQAQAPEFAANAGDVVAWNFKGFEQVSAGRQDRIVRVLEDLDAEVVAAVEVNPTRVLGDVASELTERGVCYNVRMIDQPSVSMDIGVIAKCGVQLSNARLVPGSDAGNEHLRKAFAVDVALGEFDLTLIAVHLKAGRSSDDRAIRDQQTEAIASFITKVTSGEEKDVLVVGDYNMIPGSDTSNFHALNPSGFLRFVSSEDLAGESSHLSGSGCSEGNLLDGYAISRNHSAEFVEGSLRIPPVHLEREMSLCDFKAEVSDHLPLAATFRVDEDDDGAREAGGLRIVGLLPNPDGVDHGAESVTVENTGSRTVTLDGWRIADDDGNQFPLAGNVPAGQTREIILNDQPAMLNNDGDIVRLLSPSLEEFAVSYPGPAESGQKLECEADRTCR